MNSRPGPRIVGAAVCILLAIPTAPALGAVGATTPVAVPSSLSSERGGASLESAAAKASQVGRAVAMSLIALAFAVAGTVLAFRRDFKEAAGVFVVGMVAVLLASPAGINLLSNTVTTLFGAS